MDTLDNEEDADTKHTSGLSSGTIFINVTTNTPSTTTDAASINASILDVKTGGSTIFANRYSYPCKVIVDNFFYLVQVKNQKYCIDII